MTKTHRGFARDTRPMVPMKNAPIDRRETKQGRHAGTDGVCRSPHAAAASSTNSSTHCVDAEYYRLKALQDARRRLADEERSPQGSPKLLTLRERLARPQPPVQSRIDGWQPTGTRVILAAQHKSGKTIATQNLTRSLVDGDPWLDQYPVRAVDGTVALLDFEMSGTQLDGWFRDQRITRDDKVIAESMKGRANTFDIIDPGIRAAWAERLRARSVSYLILDCLRPCLDALDLDENHDAGRFLVALDALLTDAGIAETLVIHHMGHSAERSRGDSRILDWPDASWTLVRETDDPASARFIKAYGRDVEQPEQRLAYDATTRRLSVDGGSRRDSATQDALEALLEVLGAATEPLSVRGIQEAMEASEFSRDTVRDAIKRGVASDQISTKSGPRNAILHQRAAVCDERAAHTASECERAYIDTHAHTPAGDNQQAESARTLDYGDERRLDPELFRFDPREAFGPCLDLDESDDDHLNLEDLDEF